MPLSFPQGCTGPAFRAMEAAAAETIAQTNMLQPASLITPSPFRLPRASDEVRLPLSLAFLPSPATVSFSCFRGFHVPLETYQVLPWATPSSFGMGITSTMKYGTVDAPALVTTTLTNIPGLRQISCAAPPPGLGFALATNQLCSGDLGALFVKIAWLCFLYRPRGRKAAMKCRTPSQLAVGTGGATRSPWVEPTLSLSEWRCSLV